MQFRLGLTVFVLISACSAVVAGEANYVGIDYKYRSMHGKSEDNYSMRQALPTYYNGGQVYFAHRFPSDVGISFGYEQTQNKQEVHVFSGGEEFLGDPQNAGDVSVISNRLRAFQLDILGYLTFKERLDVIGQFGFSVMQADMSGTIRSAGVTTNLSPSKNYWPFIPRVGIGLQYFIGHFGIRGMLNWEGTELYQIKMTDDDGIRMKIRPFRQSWCGALGIVARF